MSVLPPLQIEIEGTGISRPLSEHVNLLGGLLGQVIQEMAGPEMLELVETLRRLCKQAALENRPELLAVVTGAAKIGPGRPPGTPGAGLRA